MDKNIERLHSDFRVVQKTLDVQTLDLTASIPEDRILAKLYQISSFGVKIPKEID